MFGVKIASVSCLKVLKQKYRYMVFVFVKYAVKCDSQKGLLTTHVFEYIRWLSVACVGWWRSG